MLCFKTNPGSLYTKKLLVISRIYSKLDQCCRSGSGIRCLFDPGSGIRRSGFRNRFFRILDPKAVFVIAIITIILSVLVKKNFFTCPKNKIIYNFMIFVATKKGRTKFLSPSSFVAVGSGIRNPGSGMDKNQDPG
jgi:hypothetical protein